MAYKLILRFVSSAINLISNQQEVLNYVTRKCRSKSPPWTCFKTRNLDNKCAAHCQPIFYVKFSCENSHIKFLFYVFYDRVNANSPASQIFCNGDKKGLTVKLDNFLRTYKVRPLQQQRLFKYTQNMCFATFITWRRGRQRDRGTGNEM